MREQVGEGGGEVWVGGQVEGMLESNWILGKHIHPEFLVGALPFVVRLWLGGGAW